MFLLVLYKSKLIFFFSFFKAIKDISVKISCGD